MNLVVTMKPEALPEATSISLSLPETMSFEEWEAVGAELANRAKKLNWWIGDWWAAGHHRYGDRARLAARGLFGKEFKTLANIASVCRAFEPGRRREELSWSHHAEAAALSPNAADMLLDLAERDKMSKAQVRAAVTTIRGGAPARPGSAELAGLYRAYNRLSPALRMEAARAFAAFAESGAEIDPDTGRARAEPEPEPEPQAEAEFELPTQAAADAIIDHDTIAARAMPEDEIDDAQVEQVEDDVLDLALAATDDTPPAEDEFFPHASDDWDAPDAFEPAGNAAPAAPPPLDFADFGSVLDLEEIAAEPETPRDVTLDDETAEAGASEAVLVLEGLAEVPQDAWNEAFAASDAVEDAPLAGASEAVLDLEALGVPLPDHAPEPVLDLAGLEGSDGDVLDLGALAQDEEEPSPSR
ncbi:hypothetical protein [Novosphingobium sp. JCM 18896]|uniref:hypothetical protein n=1 Tax=Novosphingobium sp. JCM 18896 TaxID=2989731 RepID=UPI0022224AE9|nr:hypothetical protein [Novosphingobium sp. JCM 18896]MCW1428463.1 hypothetical protein [Novosphingobium sp. JCM 18896]